MEAPWHEIPLTETSLLTLASKFAERCLLAACKGSEAAEDALEICCMSWWVAERIVESKEKIKTVVTINAINGRVSPVCV